MWTILIRTHYPVQCRFTLTFHNSEPTHTRVISRNIEPKICVVIWADWRDNLGLFLVKGPVVCFLVPVQKSHERWISGQPIKQTPGTKSNTTKVHVTSLYIELTSSLATDPELWNRLRECLGPLLAAVSWGTLTPKAALLSVKRPLNILKVLLYKPWGEDGRGCLYVKATPSSLSQTTAALATAVRRSHNSPSSMAFVRPVPAGLRACTA